jgi:DNA-binding Lrp family transcriptional regulator
MARGQDESLMLPELHRRIALLLIHNPGATNNFISQKVGKHINTVAPIVQELKQSVLSESFHVLDWEAIGLGLRYRVDILINQRRLLNGGGPEDIGKFLSSERVEKLFLRHAENVNSQERLARFIMYHLVDYVAWRLEGGSEAKTDNTAKPEDTGNPVRPAKSSEALKNYTERIYVEDVTILLGHQADLSAAVRVHNSDVIRRFVTDGLRLLAGINSTSTSQEVWSCFEP